ncbi:hypothetical protein [Evansella clarkii]|uniref:hypothetical protein n=1 Tax=Evansella clarkii TaxID=79879 RepID=UPI00099669A4|nr:hypothetical protein [Evansella clarkii]
MSDNTVHPYKPWLFGVGALFIIQPISNSQYLLQMIIMFCTGLIISLSAITFLFNSSNYTSNNIPPIKHIKQGILAFLCIAPVLFVAGSIIHQEAIIQRGAYTAICMIFFTPLLLFINKKVLPRIEESGETREIEDSEEKDGGSSNLNTLIFYGLIVLVGVAIYFIIN